MSDWEDEPVSPVPKKALIETNWDDEDAEDDGIKESWEDEESIPEPLLEPEPSAPKSIKKAGAKSTESKGKAVVEEKEEVLDPVAEKLRQQRLVEEADYKSTTELFARKGDEKSLDTFIPKSENDFLEYAELVAHKLRPYEKSFHYINLLKATMRLSMTSLKGAEAKEVASSITAIVNEKIKAEKEATAGKKKPAKKKQVLVDKPDDDLAASGYEALDDYDFM
ncbi:hypothetical protein IFM89_039420 [Coptis chinensis]|uniref:Eukaryotic translation initiation factor 3 subunit J n=1 Tax=Coptis chinensis TaxID=261450 RepID=A0A835M385_9MAGN|nr:hypothetical protein IFM89_039420 [Coptis chinensis]